MDLGLFIINLIFVVAAAFLGSFFGFLFTTREKKRDEKNEVYNKLLEALPTAIPIAHGDIAKGSDPTGNPKTYIKALELSVSELRLKRENADDAEKSAIDQKLSSAEHTINQLNQYTEFYDSTMKNMKDFETSEYHNSFKVFASHSVKQAYADLYVALSNDYYKTGAEISSKNMSILLKELLTTIEAEKKKSQF